jgi:phosphatidylglycerophosphate synthase
MTQSTQHPRPSGATRLRAIPNALTLLRIAAAVAFPFAPVEARIPLVLFAALSDFLDGWIARRYALTSWVGALLDGIADKALTLAVLFTFTLEGTLTLWQLLLVMTRDVAVVAIAIHLAWHRAWPEFTRMSARMPGKVTTVAVFLLMAVLLLAPGLTWLAVWPAIILSVLAAIDYVLIFLSIDVKRR